MKEIFFALQLGMFFTLSAQVTETRTASAFNSMKLSGALKVYYRHSDTLSLKVRCVDKEAERVSTVFENNGLQVSNRGKFTGPVEIYVSSNQPLSKVEADGATVFVVQDSLSADSLRINLNGAAKADLKLNVTKLYGTLSGASKLVVKGSTEDMNMVLSGASSLRAYEMTSKNADVTTSGASSARIFVTTNLKARASGASNIWIKGNPVNVHSESSIAAGINKVTDAGIRNPTVADADSTSYKWQGKKIIVVKSGKEENPRRTTRLFKHWRGMLLGFNGFVSPVSGFNMSGKYKFLQLEPATNLQLNIIERQFLIAKNYFKLTTGFGFDYHEYDFKNFTTLKPDSSYTWGKIDSSGSYEYLGGGLRAWYIQVPLLLEFNTSSNPRRSLYLGVGVVGQYKIDSWTKQSFQKNADYFTKSHDGAYNLNRYAAKLHLHLGYGKILGFYAEYGLNGLFKQDKGPEVHPVAAGLVFSL